MPAAINGQPSLISADLAMNIGRVKGLSSIHKFGFSSSIGTSAFQPVTTLAALAWLTAGTTLRVKAGNAADTAAGSGARKIMVEGLSATTWLAATEELVTNGASAGPAGSQAFIRVNRAYVTDVGTYGGNNVADVVVEDSAGTSDLIQILAGKGQTEHAAVSIAAGQTAYLFCSRVDWDSNKSGDVRLMQRRNADVISAPYTGARLIEEFAAVSGPLPLPYGSFPAFPGKTDIWVEAQANVSTGSCSAAFDLWVVND